MHRTRTALLAALTLAFFAVQIGCAPANCKTCTSADGVLIHLSSPPDDAHSLLMGLRMAQVMSESHPVLVYVDVHAIPIVLRDAPDLNMQPFGSSQVMIKDLLAQGVTMQACQGCLTALGKSPRDLLPGVEIADRDTFFSFASGRIVTLDY